jgi:hypothetical protein
LDLEGHSSISTLDNLRLQDWHVVSLLVDWSDGRNNLLLLLFMLGLVSCRWWNWSWWRRRRHLKLIVGHGEVSVYRLKQNVLTSTIVQKNNYLL